MLNQINHSIKYILISFLFMLIAVRSTVSLAEETERPLLQKPPWPEWVHHHWVWENSGTGASATKLVDDYLERKIPVGAVIIDRPWQTEPNTFIPDPKLYPELEKRIQAFHKKGVRVFMWITSVINENASTFEEAKKNGYFLSNGKTVKWWAGRGAYIDYTNPEALEWWHQQMDPILDMKIDGWKCDGTDPFVIFLAPAKGVKGNITWNDYRDSFYRDFFEYTRKRLGNDRVITARPCDDGGSLPLPMPFAPRDVNFAGWVGDQDGTFDGMKAALLNMKHSSQRRYVNFGSDIGGFRGSGLRDRELMIRWTQLGALCPIMENGGGGEHRPWKYDQEVTDIYRKYVRLHHELIPYFYSKGAKAWNENVSMMKFTGSHSYLLGDDFFVAAMVEPGKKRQIKFPEGEWISWLNEEKVYPGNQTKSLQFSLEDFPVYVCRGSIIPLDVTDASTEHGNEFSQGHLTLAAYPEKGKSNSFDLCQENGPGARFSYDYKNDSLILKSTSLNKPLLWRVNGLNQPSKITLENGLVLSKVSSKKDLNKKDQCWAFMENTLWIRIQKPDRDFILHVE